MKSTTRLFPKKVTLQEYVNGFNKVNPYGNVNYLSRLTFKPTKEEVSAFVHLIYAVCLRYAYILSGNAKSSYNLCYSHDLTLLSIAIVRIVLKSLLDKSDLPIYRKLYYSLHNDEIRYHYASENTDLLVDFNFSDCSDLISVVTIALLEWLQRMDTSKCFVNNKAFLLEDVLIVKPNRRVYIKNEDFTRVKFEFINGIHYACRQARNHVQSLASPKDISINQYIDISVDYGIESAIYRRLVQYVDYTGIESSINADITVADNGIVRDIDAIESALYAVLSPQEKTVYRLRMQGNGNRAIATAMNISLSSVKTVRQRIMKKARAIGLSD